MTFDPGIYDIACADTLNRAIRSRLCDMGNAERLWLCGELLHEIESIVSECDGSDPLSESDRYPSPEVETPATPRVSDND